MMENSCGIPALRVATYNVHGCVGTDGVCSEERVARVIASLDADIAGLQELDLNRRRSLRADQAALIADWLGWERFFHPALKRGEEEYGDAVISRFPLTLRKGAELPAKPAPFCREPRGAVWVEAMTPFGPCHVINTHLGLGFRERLTQAALLAGPDWLGAVPPEEPLILLGDFNCPPLSAPMRLLRRALRPSPGLKTPAAFPSRRPLLALDHILVNHRLRITRLEAVKTEVARSASDHLPLLAEIALNG